MLKGLIVIVLLAGGFWLWRRARRAATPAAPGDRLRRRGASRRDDIDSVPAYSSASSGSAFAFGSDAGDSRPRCGDGGSDGGSDSSSDGGGSCDSGGGSDSSSSSSSD
ncbi:MAG: hypothetical protein U1E77_12580 [Inhella sp.]